jgi:hypothetical protein
MESREAERLKWRAGLTASELDVVGLCGVTFLAVALRWKAEPVMAKKDTSRTYEEAAQWLRDHGFDLLDAPGVQNRIFLKKYNCSAALEKNAEGGVRIFAYPGYLISGEISKLINRGYQQFLKTTKTEVPATADKLHALHQFTEELKEAIGAPSLYNESLGTVAENYVYDRVQDRDEPTPERPKRPWEEAASKGKRRA